MAKVLGVIPARFEDQRFPGKLLANIGGKPMIQWVYEAAGECSELDKIVIGTDDERIREAVESFGGEVLMTLEEHKTGTDRLAEVAEFFGDYEIVVNIQGDHPGVDPALISGVARLKKNNPEWAVTTAARPLGEGEDPLPPNIVKVAVSRRNRALYFTRSLIPFPRNNTSDHPIYVHIGIYAYQRDFLLRFNTMPRSGLEETESLEQLRVLENDYNIGVHLVQESLPGVSTQEDLGRLQSRMRAVGKLT